MASQLFEKRWIGSLSETSNPRNPKSITGYRFMVDDQLALPT
jgi:hypothetical protein